MTANEQQICSISSWLMRINSNQECESNEKRKGEASEKDNVSPTKIMQQNENNSLKCPDLLAEFEKKMQLAKKEEHSKKKEEEEEIMFENWVEDDNQSIKIDLEFGDEIQEILNVQVIDNQLMFYILCEGSNKPSYVPVQIVHKVAPNQAVAFFASRLSFNDPL